MEQFPAREEEEVTETEISRDGQPVVPLSGYEDPLHYEDPVMQISGTGHWIWKVGSATIRWNSWWTRDLQ